MWCVGLNNHGTTGGSSASAPYGNKVNLGQGRTATALDSYGSGYHVCALLDNGDTKCWGDNRWGQLGLGDKEYRGGTDAGTGMGDLLPPVNVGTNRKVKKLMAAHRFTCAILDDQSLKCWGRGELGQLGFLPNAVSGGYGNNNGEAGDAPNEMGNNLPTVDLGGNPAIDGDAGTQLACAIVQHPTDGQQLTCWGRNMEGQLGRGSSFDDSKSEPNYAPINLGTDLYAVQVSTGWSYACALLNTGAASWPFLKLFWDL